MLRLILPLVLTVAATALAGCQTPVVDQTGPLSIRSVTVSAKPEVKSATDLRAAVEASAASALANGDPAGRPVDVRISLDRVTYKNPLGSLLVGSANALNSTVTIDGDGGQTLASFPQAVVTDAAINGVIGAVIAASQDQGNVDAKLASEYGRSLRTRIFGKPGYKPKTAAPPRKATPPVAAPAPVPAPTTAPVS